MQIACVQHVKVRSDGIRTKFCSLVLELALLTCVLGYQWLIRLLIIYLFIDIFRKLLLYSLLSLFVIKK